MDLLKSLKKSILEFLESGSENTEIYKEIEENRGKMNPEEVLAIIAPLIAQENLALKERQTSLILFPPTLQECEETGNRQWLITVLYERLNGKLLNEDERIVCFWMIVQDESGEIGEKIYPR